jgi:Flp pilus assembly pilin Flp
MKFGNRRSGQAMTEYIILVSMLIVAFLAVGDIFVAALGNFYSNVSKVICLPLP